MLSANCSGVSNRAILGDDHPATQRYKVRACSEIGVERLNFVAVDFSAAGLDKEALLDNRSSR